MRLASSCAVPTWWCYEDYAQLYT